MRGKHGRRVAAKVSRQSVTKPPSLSPGALDARPNHEVKDMAEQQPDYREMCWIDLQVKAQDWDASSRVVRFIASTESVDSHDEIVEQDWIFDRFDKNPAILYNHNKPTGSAGLNREETLPIGKGVGRGVVDVPGHGKQLWIDVEFAPPELNTFADQVFRNVQAGFVKASSVGFKPHDVTAEKAAGGKRYRLRKNELYELSVLPLGSNAGAVRLSPEDRDLHAAYLESLCEKSINPSETPKEPQPMTEPAIVTTAAEVPVQAGADVEKLKALEIESTQLREKLAARDKADAEREVDAIIGKSIVPTQRADFLKLRSLDADLFASITKSLPDLKLEGTVIPAAPIVVEPQTNTTKSAEYAGARAARQLRPSKES